MEISFVSSMKIAWSFLWRSLLICMFVFVCLWALFSVIGFFVKPLVVSLLPGHEQLLCVLSLGLMGFLMGIVFLYAAQWSYNQLPTVEYAEERVLLMREDKPVNEFSLRDTVCFIWSLCWRYGLILFIITFIIMNILVGVGYIKFGKFDIQTMWILLAPWFKFGEALNFLFLSITQLVQLGIFFAAMHLILLHKRTGRWIRVVHKSQDLVLPNQYDD